MTKEHSRKHTGTSICAIKDRKGRIWMAADRRASWHWSKFQTMPRPKLMKRNGLILAGTGSGALCHLIVDMLDFPEIEDNDTDHYMHNVIYGRTVALLKKKGYADDKNTLKIAPDDTAEIVIACQNKLYTMEIVNPDPLNSHPNGLITIDEVSLPYTTGCGGEYAKGAIDTLKLQGVNDSKVILKIAIEVAAMNSPGCDSAIDIERED